MSFGGAFSGGSQSGRSTSTTSTPWTNIANQLAGSLKSNLQSLAGGSNVANWIKSITESTKQGTKEGIANIKSAFAGTGMAGSTDLMRNISDFQTKQQLGLDTQISQIQQQGISDQLGALQEIISLASGSGTQVGHQWGDYFGWQASAQSNLFSPQKP